MANKNWYSVAFLRTEGLAIFVLAAYAYSGLWFSWIWFFVLLLLPDVSMMGYLINKKTGAVVYNLGHSLTLPIILLFITALINEQYFSYFGTYLDTLIEMIPAFAVIWVAHIGMDRALGFGLKTSEGFEHTHLGKIGKSPR